MKRSEALTGGGDEESRGAEQEEQTNRRKVWSGTVVKKMDQSGRRGRRGVSSDVGGG